MPKKKYIVTLIDEERAALKELVNKGKNPAYKVNHARILLLADTNQSGGGWKDRDISQALKISVATIEGGKLAKLSPGASSLKPLPHKHPRLIIMQLSELVAFHQDLGEKFRKD